MGWKELISRFGRKDERWEELQHEDKLQTRLQERKKNSNERELEKYMEEDRQRRIKVALDNYREQRKKEFWENHSLDKGRSILKNERPILKEKYIFTGGATVLRNNKKMSI